MKLLKKYKENKAILIDEEKLKYFDLFLNGFFSRRKYKCNCSDNSELGFDDLQEVLDYENPDFRKIIEIEIYADNKADTSSLNFVYHEFRIELGGNWSDQTLRYSIDSKDIPKMTQFESELKSRIKEFRPWYWWICKISFVYTVMFIGLVYSLIQGTKSLFAKLQGEKVTEFPSLELNEWYVIIALVLLIGVLIHFTLDRFKTYLFPKVIFELGIQKKRNSRRYNLIYLIFVGIILAFIINILSNWAWDKFK